MNFEDKLNKIEKKVEKVKNENESIALSLIRDYKKQNKRLFIVIIILCIMLISLGIYTIWLLNDIGYEEITETTTTEYTQDIDDVGDITESNIVNGGDING